MPRKKKHEEKKTQKKKEEEREYNPFSSIVLKEKKEPEKKRLQLLLNQKSLEKLSKAMFLPLLLPISSILLRRLETHIVFPSRKLQRLLLPLVTSWINGKERRVERKKRRKKSLLLPNIKLHAPSAISWINMKAL